MQLWEPVWSWHLRGFPCGGGAGCLHQHLGPRGYALKGGHRTSAFWPVEHKQGGPASRVGPRAGLQRGAEVSTTGVKFRVRRDSSSPYVSVAVLPRQSPTNLGAENNRNSLSRSGWSPRSQCGQSWLLEALGENPSQASPHTGWPPALAFLCLSLPSELSPKCLFDAHVSTNCLCKAA